jgi:hypothetical protein
VAGASVFAVLDAAHAAPSSGLDWPLIGQILGPVFGGAVIYVWNYFREPKTPKPATDLVVTSANLSDRPLINALMDQLMLMRGATERNTEAVERSNELLEAEALARHDDEISKKAVRDYLTSREKP